MTCPPWLSSKIRSCYINLLFATPYLPSYLPFILDKVWYIIFMIVPNLFAILPNMKHIISFKTSFYLPQIYLPPCQVHSKLYITSFCLLCSKYASSLPTQEENPLYHPNQTYMLVANPLDLPTQQKNPLNHHKQASFSGISIFPRYPTRKASISSKTSLLYWPPSPTKEPSISSKPNFCIWQTNLPSLPRPDEKPLYHPNQTSAVGKKTNPPLPTREPSISSKPNLCLWQTHLTSLPNKRTLYIIQTKPMLVANPLDLPTQQKNPLYHPNQTYACGKPTWPPYPTKEPSISSKPNLCLWQTHLTSLPNKRTLYIIQTKPMLVANPLALPTQQKNPLNHHKQASFSGISIFPRYPTRKASISSKTSLLYWPPSPTKEPSISSKPNFCFWQTNLPSLPRPDEKPLYHPNQTSAFGKKLTLHYQQENPL